MRRTEPTLCFWPEIAAAVRHPPIAYGIPAHPDIVHQVRLALFVPVTRIGVCRNSKGVVKIRFVLDLHTARCGLRTSGNSVRDDRFEKHRALRTCVLLPYRIRRAFPYPAVGTQRGGWRHSGGGFRPAVHDLETKPDRFPSARLRPPLSYTTTSIILRQGAVQDEILRIKSISYPFVNLFRRSPFRGPPATGREIQPRPVINDRSSVPSAGSERREKGFINYNWISLSAGSVGINRPRSR